MKDKKCSCGCKSNELCNYDFLQGVLGKDKKEKKKPKKSQNQIFVIKGEKKGKNKK
tara:strand:+ start:7081 stop:7248 length:168 start_codon:yes stop_codon:yes gene_type:complete